MTKAQLEAAREAARVFNGLRKVKSGGHNGGRKRSDAPRCPAGCMTLKRAKTRGHKCEEQRSNL